jgi:hypothetical protein
MQSKRKDIVDKALKVTSQYKEGLLNLGTISITREMARTVSYSHLEDLVSLTEYKSEEPTSLLFYDLMELTKHDANLEKFLHVDQLSRHECGPECRRSIEILKTIDRDFALYNVLNSDQPLDRSRLLFNACEDKLQLLTLLRNEILLYVSKILNRLFHNRFIGSSKNSHLGTILQLYICQRVIAHNPSVTFEFAKDHLVLFFNAICHDGIVFIDRDTVFLESELLLPVQLFMEMCVDIAHFIVGRCEDEDKKA